MGFLILRNSLLIPPPLAPNFPNTTISHSPVPFMSQPSHRPSLPRAPGDSRLHLLPHSAPRTVPGTHAVLSHRISGQQTHSSPQGRFALHPPALRLSFPLSGVLCTLMPCSFPARAHHLLMLPSAPHQQQHLWVLGGPKDSETISRDTMSTVSGKSRASSQRGTPLGLGGRFSPHASTG